MKRFAVLTFLCLLTTTVCADTVTEPIRQFGYGQLTCAAYSPDGNHFLTGSADGKARPRVPKGTPKPQWQPITFNSKGDIVAGVNLH